MSAYRSTDDVEPGETIEVYSPPRWLVVSLALLGLILFVRPLLASRTVRIECRGTEATCVVDEQRVHIPVAHRTIAIDSVRDIRTAPLREGEGSAIIANGKELARFSHSEASGAHLAAVRLALGEPVVEVRAPLDGFASLLGLPFVVAAFALRRRPTTIHVSTEWLRIGEKLVLRDDIESIDVTEEPANTRFALVLRMHDGSRVAIVERALLRGSLDRAAIALRNVQRFSRQPGGASSGCSLKNASRDSREISSSTTPSFSTRV